MAELPKDTIYHYESKDGMTVTVTMTELVRCKDCRHRILNEHYGEKGYMKLKAMCELDTGDPFELSRYAEDDDWYCADGERKDEVTP